MARILGIKKAISKLKKISEEDFLREIYFSKRAQIRESVINTLRASLREHHTYQKIHNEELNGHFGFYPGEGADRAEQIVSAIIDDVIIVLDPAAKSIRTSVTVNYEELYNLEAAIVYNISQKSVFGITPTVLNWLKWLLEGHTIQNYRIHFKDGQGRSEEAVMEPTGSSSVPPEVAGTIEFNWLSESFANARNDLSNRIKRIINA